jgi:hypothetical protein
MQKKLVPSLDTKNGGNFFMWRAAKNLLARRPDAAQSSKTNVEPDELQQKGLNDL